ncbi:response regulator transcription factor [Elongatibacter sediminis]|uniref:Response regulator transcription factor n=1 Tax=Elongatibacter sediminis TaxID=3119006 RepID=A0AAW9RIQ1_9GAMM
MTTTILLIEDHADLAATVGDELEAQGYTMDFAADGASGLGLAMTQSYDLIVLDLMLPKLDGMEVCRRLREQRVDTPILMLTARDQVSDKVEGFDTGADDYLVKPFDMDELAARIKALLRRSRGEVSESELRVGDLCFDTGSLRVERAGKRINLSPTGLRILRILMRESPRVVTREALEQELWGDLLPDSDTLRSHLYNLRREVDRPFETKLLHTLPGIGFKIAEPGDA